jgi:hypothetical protein
MIAANPYAFAKRCKLHRVRKKIPDDEVCDLKICKCMQSQFKISLYVDGFSRAASFISAIFSLINDQQKNG